MVEINDIEYAKFKASQSIVELQKEREETHNLYQSKFNELSGELSKKIQDIEILIKEQQNILNQ